MIDIRPLLMYNPAIGEKNQNMKKLICYTIVLALWFLTLPFVSSTVSADEGCGAYGTNCDESSKLIIDKYIRDPRAKNDAYVDNLSYDDYRFSPGEDIIFKIVVKNTGTNILNNVKIKDIIPTVTNMIILSGEIRSEMREITKDWGSVGPNETREWYFRVRVRPVGEIGNNVVCASPDGINRAVVSADGVGDEEDTSSFCVEKNIQGASSQPDTGAPLVILFSILGSVAAAGSVVRKFV